MALCRRGLALCIKSISNIWPRGCSNGSTPAADIQMPSTDTNANHPEEGLSKNEAELIQNRPTPGNPVFGLRHPARPTRKSGTAAFWVLTRTLSRARPWIWKSSGRTERGRLLPSFCGSILPSRWTITRTVGFCRLFCAKFCAHRSRNTASTASPQKPTQEPQRGTHRGFCYRSLRPPGRSPDLYFTGLEELYRMDRRCGRPRDLPGLLE